MLQPVTVDKQSPFLGQECALCRDPLAPGDTVVICPEDGSRHHDRCWIANGHQCAAYGCPGHGEILTPSPHPGIPHRPSTHPPILSPPQPLTRSQNCANTCLILAIAISILFFSIGCFGLWAIADYLMLNVWNLPYRAPFSGLILPVFFFFRSV